MERKPKKLKMYNRITIDSYVKITNPGRNRPNSYNEAKIMGATRYKGISIYNNPTIHEAVGWYVVNQMRDRDGKMLNLIANKDFNMELVIASEGLTYDKEISERVKAYKFKNEDFLI